MSELERDGRVFGEKRSSQEADVTGRQHELVNARNPGLFLHAWKLASSLDRVRRAKRSIPGAANADAEVPGTGPPRWTLHQAL